MAAATFCALTAALAVVKQSTVNQVNLELDVISGFFAHLYVTLPTLVVDPDFVHETPFETLVAACAGTATMTPPATMSATDNDAILRSMKEPFVVMRAILSIEYLKKTENAPRVSRRGRYLRCFFLTFIPTFLTIDRGNLLITKTKS